MGLPVNIHASTLHDMRMRTMRGLPFDSEHIDAMIEVLDTLLDEAQDAEEPHGSIDDLVGCIARLEKARKDAVEAKDELETEKDEEIAKFVKERDDIVKDHESTLERIREEHEAEIAKVREDYEADFARQQARVTEANAARVLAETKLAELKATDVWKVLADLVATASNLDAVRVASSPRCQITKEFRVTRNRALDVLQGRPQPTPTEIPTRSSRRRTKKGA